MTSAFRVVTAADGKRDMVDADGIRQATETAPGIWELAAVGGNWPGIVEFAKGILATPDPCPGLVPHAVRAHRLESARR